MDTLTMAIVLGLARERLVQIDTLRRDTFKPRKDQEHAIEQAFKIEYSTGMSLSTLESEIVRMQDSFGKAIEGDHPHFQLTFQTPLACKFPTDLEAK